MPTSAIATTAYGIKAKDNPADTSLQENPSMDTTLDFFSISWDALFSIYWLMYMYVHLNRGKYIVLKENY